MTTQNYLIIEENVVTNNVVWDGNINTWQPPANSIALPQTTILAKIWTIPTETTFSVLYEVIGAGGINFTWDGVILTTNEPQPIYVPPING
jgi:hypothetical protein